MARRTERQKKRAGRYSGGVRPIWSGTITFGLVSVPVHLYPASRSRRASFRMLDQDGTPLSRRYLCPVHEHTVHPEHILRGFPLGDDEYIIVRDDELRSLQPRKSRDIDLRQFINRSEVPPIFFERAYLLTPAGDSTKAYRLLVEVMQQTDRAGVATFVMRDKEYLVAILAEGGVLRAETLRFEDEIRSPKDVGLPAPSKTSASLVSKFRKVIRSREHKRLDESDLTDKTDHQLRKIVERKLRRGKDVVEQREKAADQEQDGEEAPTIDLLETIRRSLRQDPMTNGNGKPASRSNGRDSGASKQNAAPQSEALASQSKKELYRQAQELEIAGRSSMNKKELVRAIEKAET